MAIRFDTTQILRKPEITPEGYLRAEAAFARDGILEYRLPDGSVRKELRTPEENRKALLSFGLKGVTIEHPPVLLDSSNSKEYAVGMSDSTVVYDQGGFVRGVITSFDSKAIEMIRSGEKVEISAGYQCEVNNAPGVWKGEHYDAVQTNICVNHIALTSKGRAGSDVRIHLDSFEGEDPDIGVEISKNTSIRKSMARYTLDSVEYEEIPEGFAHAVAQKLKEFDKLQVQLDSAKSELDEVFTDRDRAYGRADGFEEILDAATPLLKNLGFKWDADDREFVRADGKKWTPEMMDEDDEEEGEDEEEMPFPPKKSKKTPKTDSVAELLQAWREVETLVPDIGSRFDSSLDATEVRKLAIAHYLPDVDLTNRTDSYIAGLYDSIKLDAEDEDEYEEEDEEIESEEEGDEEEEEERTDSYTHELGTAIRSTRGDAKVSDCVSEADKRRMDNCKKPLGMSKL